MKRTIRLLLILLLPLILGAGIALFQIQKAVKVADFRVYNGSWRVSEKMDLANNPFQRAVIARIGLFALRESEVLYAMSSQDSEGRPLEAKYDYEIIGKQLDTRYWSFTLYGNDFFLIDNPSNKYGINLDNIAYQEDSLTGDKTFRIVISQQPKPINWLPAGNTNQALHINFRLYNPSPSVYENIKTIDLPIVRRIEKTDTNL